MRTRGDVSVLVVSHPTAMWGAQVRLLDLAPHLAERGVVMTLAAPGEGPLPAAWRALGLPFRETPLPPHRGLNDEDGRRGGVRHQATEAWAISRSIPALVAPSRASDVVFSYTLWAHLESVTAARIARRPVIIDVVDIVSPGLGRRFLQRLSRLADGTIVNSRATADTLGTAARRLHLIHPGVDLTRFTPGPVDDDLRGELGAGPDDVLVGIVGRVDPEKGVHVLVEAMSMLPSHHRARLVVVGDSGVGRPGYLAEVGGLARDALDGRVTFAGRRQDIPNVMRALDILVNASRAEPFGLTVVEAQACATAVIGTAAGGIPEFVTDDVNGLLVEPCDPAALAQALERLISDGDLRRRLGNQGRCQAEERFGLDAQYEVVAKVFRTYAP